MTNPPDPWPTAPTATATTPEPLAAGTSRTAPPAKRRRWVRWVVPVVAAVLGVGLGAAVAGGGDPTQTDEYRALQADVDAARGQIRVATTRAGAAESAASSAAASAASASAELVARESAVAAREQAVTAVEQSVAANSVGEGTWTVGVDIEPGTYRTSEPVGSDCYWEITRSGTNGSDIVENGIPGGGIPTVTVSEGQDFTNHRCGTFVRQ